MNNKTITQSATKMGEQQKTRTSLQILLYRAPKKNNETIAKKNLKRFMPWFKEPRARAEYYQQLDKSEFFGLVTEEKGLITGGFRTIRE